VKIAANIISWVLVLAAASSYGQNANPPQYVAPSELTILKHNLNGEHRFVTEATPQSERGGEPATRVVSQQVMTLSVKVRSNTAKPIVGVSWFFVLTKNSKEDYFSLPFVTPVAIGPQNERTFKAEVERLPKHPRTVTVDELRQTGDSPPRERIVITCVAFADGTTSPLNEASKSDCRRLETSPEIKKKIEKPGAPVSN
jgi:hypothetical protein